MQGTKQVTALDGVTETTVSAPIGVKYARKVTLQFSRANHTAGSSVFRVQGSIDGDHYEGAVVMVHNAPNNLTQNLQRVISATLNADGTEFYALDLEHLGYTDIMVRADVNTDGDATCKMLIEY